LRKGNYQQAELDSYQLLIKFNKDSNLKWDDDYFKYWIISKLLLNKEQNLELNPNYFINEINNLLNFAQPNKKPIHYLMMIFDIFEHELLKDISEELVGFGTTLFIEIIISIDLIEKKVINLIAEKVTFERKLFGKFNPIVIEHIDILINQFKPSNRREELYKTYLYCVKALILFRNGRFEMASKISQKIIRNLSENDIYTTYYDVNDLFLDSKRYNS
jgi:hypothetical protein